MGRFLKVFLLIGAIVVGGAFYGINNVSAQPVGTNSYVYPNYGTMPVQAVLTTTGQDDLNADQQNNDNNNSNPSIPLPSYSPYMMGPGMMWGNPNYDPNANNGQLPPGYNSYPPNYGWGYGWCW